jgi:MFS family permease
MGPGVGGLILLTLGPTWGILFNALIYVPFFLWLMRAPFEHKVHPPAVRGLADLKVALQATAANPVILGMVLLVGGASLIVGNAYQAQMPEFAHDLGHADGGLTYSLLFGADAAGAFTAGILLETRSLLRPSPRTAVLLAMAWCVAMAGFALNQWYPLALVLLFACGFLELSFYAMAQTLVQLNAPAEVRGRVIGLFAMSALGLRAFSGVTVGIGGALIGIHLSLALSAGVLFMVFLVLVAKTKSVQ